MLGIQRNNGFARFQQVEDEELHQIGFTLTGVAENENIGGCFILIPLIKVYKDVAAVLVPSNIKSHCIGFAAVIERIKICY